MTGDALTVFLILAVTIALFVSDKFRLDLVALMSAAALVLTGVLTPNQALAGFSDSLVITIAGLFVVSGALFRTGVAGRMGVWMGRMAGDGEGRLIFFIMLVTAALSAVMSSTGTVAVMLPVVVSLAWRAKISPSRLLIPLSFASLLGGMVTLIGTPPNIAVSQQLVSQGLAPFHFFDFTGPGLVMLAIGIVFMVFVGRHLLPARAPAEPVGAVPPLSLSELADSYGLPAHLFRLRIPARHALEGATLASLCWPERYGVQVLAIDTDPDAVRAHQRSRRHLHRSKRIAAATVMDHDDRVLIEGPAASVERLAADLGLDVVAVDASSMPEDLNVVEVLPTPRSRWLGQTLRELAFRERFGVQVMSVQRGGASITEGLASLALRFGDTLLVQGPQASLDRLKRERADVVALAEPNAGAVSKRAARRAPVAMGVMVAMLIVMTVGWLPTVVAVGLAAIAMVLTGCLSMEEAYTSINWESLVLIAGVLPMATALQVTGGIQVVVDALVAAVGPSGPLALMAGIFVLTSLASQVISNTATAVLIAPIAFQAASELGVSPYPLLITVALAASTAFATPVASPVNTLVLNAGQYRFFDFTKVGLVLQLLVLVATLLVVPRFFPW